MSRIVMAYPFVPESAIDDVCAVLCSRFIGQGPLVDLFEKEFERHFGLTPGTAVAVNSGTSALELAYDLLALGPGAQVIATPLTCTATNIPLIRRGCDLVFADIERDTLNLSADSVLRKINSQTKAIVNVHLHGLESRLPDYGIPVIDDAAQALGIFRKEARFTICSFQAIKHMTTGDGGMLVCADPAEAAEAKLRRWFGIDRAKKLANNWQPFKDRKILFDINYPGYKFQMNDIAAALGLGGLRHINWVFSYRGQIYQKYRDAGLPMVDGPKNQFGYACLLVENRDEFCAEMERADIETNVMQVRNDLYERFQPFKTSLPNMDWVEERYICIPLHNRMTLPDAQRVADVAARAALPCAVARGGW